MNANTVGTECLKRIFMFVQKGFQYLIQVIQLEGEGFYEKDGSGEFL